MIGKIEVTGASLEAIVRSAYAPSTPRGLGHLHFQSGDLTNEEVAEIIDRFKDSAVSAVSMDYVKGRSVKMRVSKDNQGRLWINNRWYDHSDGELRALLQAIGLSDDLLDKSRAKENAHIAACTKAALAFLAEHGGKYVMNTLVESKDLPPLVYDGLFYGIDTKQTAIKYGGPGEGDTWTALAA